VGVAAPPANGLGPHTDSHAIHSDISKICPKQFDIPRKRPYVCFSHAAAWKADTQQFMGKQEPQYERPYVPSPYGQW